MNLNSLISTVDVHVAGHPVRIVPFHDPSTSARTMQEKCSLLRKELTGLRRRVLHPPRGHLLLRGAVVTNPVSERATAGVIFLDAYAEPDFDALCILGTAKWLYEQRRLEDTDAKAELVFDTCAGQVRVTVEKAHHDKTGEISLVTPPCYIEPKATEVSVPSMGNVRVELFHLSKWHALINEEEWRTPIDVKELNKLLLRTLFLRYMVNKEIMTESHYEGRVTYIAHLGEKLGDTAGHKIFGGHSTANYDIAPSVPGLCGHMARLHYDGSLALGEWYTAEGIVNTRVADGCCAATRMRTEREP